MNEFILKTMNELTTIITPLLFAFMAYWVKQLAGKVKVQISKIKDERQQQLLKNAIERVEDLTLKTVTAIEQTTAKTLREEVLNGIKGKEELEKLAVDAFNSIIKQLTPEYTQLLESNVNDFSKYLSDLIEAKVYELKNTKPLKLVK